jgi:lipoate-protein ligase A
VRAVLAGHLVPAAALAHDEAIARAGAGPTLLIWRTDPAVVVGRFQRVDWEVDPAACAARGVRVWRRFTGGGTVYLDAGVVCAALAWPPGHRWAALGVPEMYGPLLDGIVRALAARGVRAARDERTVRVGGRKVTGIAAHRGRTGTLVHGTVLAAADLGALTACIAGPRCGDLGGRPRPAPSRPDVVANVGELGLEAALVEAFAATPGELSTEERDRAGALQQERYDDRSWHAGPWAELAGAAGAVLGGDAPAEAGGAPARGRAGAPRR